MLTVEWRPISKWIGATAHYTESSQPTQLEQTKRRRYLHSAHLDHLLMYTNMRVGLKIGHVEVSTGRPLVSPATPAVPGPATTASHSPQPLLLNPVTPTWFRPHCPTTKTTARGPKKWSEVSPTGEKQVKESLLQFTMDKGSRDLERRRLRRPYSAASAADVGGSAGVMEKRMRREPSLEQSSDFEGSNIGGPYTGPIGWAVTMFYRLFLKNK